ncbi:MAG: hypothetical protein A2784_04585 [Candidatus Chisholmbacteria bacterium RIFCSPHIGHO2_01_FULL_48_12]|uniref:SGNH hydrolase-type esterase domain-containing protein n=1 Tax=Candidatus Chisholmbacteria bacterium RIFCSPHIGHO2_01_FULL_48_12 TaxID=1797589 RepID=A0A1G1VN16_9BACT|nr:MAG: hypothetical protein A2784_04585 [Candidatus Chisholmbacteria bacterium RIFCSPHIGHO2_01_FULL_48_12]
MILRFSYFVADFKYYLVFFLAAFVLGIVALIFKRTKFVLIFVSFLLSFVTCFLLLEAYYRYIFDATDNVYDIKTTRRWIDRHVTWNGNGYRDDHFWPDKDPRETRLAFIGDSYAFGYGIKEIQNRYTELLGQKLRDQCSEGKTLKTYNFGLPGNQSQTYVKQVPLEVIRYKPDAIVMQYYMDDIDADKPPELTPQFAQTIYGYKNLPVIGWLLKHSYALEYWYIRLSSLLSSRHNWGEFINYNETLYRNETVWSLHLSTLEHIVAATRGATKVPLVVFILPLSHRLGPDYPLTDVHQKLIDYFAGLDVPVVDMLPVLNQYRPEQIMVSKRDFHLNEFGHRLIAEELYQLVKDMPAFQCR